MTLLVQGGPANSGRKRPPKERRKTPWTCECSEQHPPYYVRCHRCRMKRPEENDGNDTT